MIVVMKPGTTKEQVQHVVDLVREYGLKEHVIQGTDRTVVACIGDKRMVDKGAIENAPMVERVVPILAPYKMASSEVKREPTIVKIGPEGFPIGGHKIGMIAGPCAVESREHIIRMAEHVKAAGCVGLRGGAFKPRTSPYSFQGHGVEGLKMLAEARDRTGLAIVTEVIGVESLPAVAEYADVLQIGARNMQHYPLLEAVGKVNKPILLKRGMAGLVEEWLLAAEYICVHGNNKVILCERGIRTFETATRNTLDLGAVAVAKKETHLPVFVDPSHAAGRADMIAPLARAAVAVGADGLMIEVHPDPATALSDGGQQLRPKQFVQLMAELAPLVQVMGKRLAG
ncbi:MAG: 3-deoxy-7-phosphoheptulonate synthase, partial [bacterium]